MVWKSGNINLISKGMYFPFGCFTVAEWVLTLYNVIKTCHPLVIQHGSSYIWPWTADTEYCYCLTMAFLSHSSSVPVCVYKKTACFTLVPPSPSLSVGSQATCSWQQRESLSGSVHFILSTHSDPLMDQTILECQRCYGMTHCPVPPTQLSNPRRDTQSHGTKVQNREVVEDRALSF